MRIASAIFLAFAFAGATSIAQAADHRPIGKTTTIPFAAGGGLRNWQVGAPGTNIVYVQDRRSQWYRVQLTGPCAESGDPGTLTYTTDTNGTFDRFSHVSAPRTSPDGSCGVVSIESSLPPRGQPGHKP